MKSAGTSVAGYPESIAKSYNGRRHRRIIEPVLPTPEQLSDQTDFDLKTPDAYKFRREIKPDYNAPCAPGYITGRSASNTFHKLVFCGKEWCPTCGSYLSPVHVRRIVNIWPKIFQLQTVNYWVVTVPLNLRPLFGKEGLNAFRRYLIRKVKREFPGCKGFSRFHWAGDKRPDLYAPHLNILFSGPGWIEPETLQRYRREISAWMKTTFKLNHYPAANIYTSYTSNTEKKKHLVNYITRATFFGNAGAIQSIIKGFRNTAPFGKWDKAEEQSTDETTLAMRNIDATDGTPIVWETQKTEKQIQKIDRETGESITITKISKKVILRPQKNFKSLVIDAGAEHIGAGIFRIPIKPPE